MDDTTFSLCASHFTASTTPGLLGLWNYRMADGKNWLSVDADTGKFRDGGMPNPGPSESFHWTKGSGRAVCDQTAIVNGILTARSAIVAEAK